MNQIPHPAAMECIRCALFLIANNRSFSSETYKAAAMRMAVTAVEIDRHVARTREFITFAEELGGELLNENSPPMLDVLEDVRRCFNPLRPGATQ